MDYLLRSIGLTYPDRHVIPAHTHPWGQVIFAAKGTMRVEASDMLWLVPQGRVLWAPAEAKHAIEARGELGLRTVYVPTNRSASLPSCCTALEADPLLRALILHIVNERQMLEVGQEEDEHLAAVFLNRLAAAPRLILNLPMPRDARMRTLAFRLNMSPASTHTLQQLARGAGASARTVQRVFLQETGMRFVEWRQRLRLIHAITQLETGASVTEAGARAGYASTSAFIAAFRAQTGETPNKFKRAKLP